MAIDLDALEQVAREAHADWASKVPTMPLRTYHTTFSPSTALALIAEVRELRDERDALQAKLDYVGTKPERARGSDAGYDLRANIDKPQWIESGGRLTIPLGVRIALDHGTAGLVIPRSGLAARYGITIVNTPGLIDPGYRGEVMAILHNTGREPFKIEPGDRVAQLLIVKVELPEFVETDDLGWTNRGANGFGSSGVK